MKTLAKSLHTVTVLVRVAQHLIETADSQPQRAAYTTEGAVSAALDILGYPDDQTLDQYDLVGKAMAQLQAGAR